MKVNRCTLVSLATNEGESCRSALKPIDSFPSLGCESTINRTFPPAPVTPNHRRWRISKIS
jgi:hypothetical protein